MGANTVDPEFLKEVWTLYAIGILVILLRFATRIKTVGIKRFQGDDYMSILTLVFFTMDAATVHIIYFTGTNVEASELQKIRPLTDKEIGRFTFGSKEQLAAWYSYTALIWTMKATMLFFFHRLTVGLWQHKFVKWLAVACAVSYGAVFLTITFGCFPIQHNWQVVPDPGLKCTLKFQNFLVTVILNVITDTAILAIPIPLLWSLKRPARQKLVIAVLLCSGIFVIAAAIIRVVLTLGANPSALNINRWGVRETIVGIITINLPILKPLLNKKFWSTSPFRTMSLGHGTSRLRNDPYELSYSKNSKMASTWDNKHGSSVKIGLKSEESLGGPGSVTGGERRGSEELIFQGARKGVYVHTTVHVVSEDLERGKDPKEGWEREGGINCTTVHPGQPL